MQIIKDQAIVEDNWQWLEISDTDNASFSLPAGDIIVPFTDWRTNQQSCLEHTGRLGVCINSHDEIHEQALVESLVKLELIALHFPVFTDGRPYSHARLLRDRYGFVGELRAVGDVLRDQLLFMQRCGINAFQLRDDKNLTDALAAFSELTVKYQTAADGAVPVYKNR
ncbi:Oxidoreductase probably involved in sulfite reduction [uncultured Candidatus Thioglobus sp.]|nr:Oxidoreductase probably involved in sulfite reduction [uncultured Candidatus Thioglobus sp.]